MGSSGADPEAMKRCLEAVERKDWQAATAFCADGVVMHFPGRSPFSGDFMGKEAFLERYDRLREELGGTRCILCRIANEANQNWLHFHRLDFLS